MLELYKDKALHFVAGLIVGCFVLIAARFFGPQPVNAFWAVAGAAFAGACKEALDAYENVREEDAGQTPTHDVSLWDFLATTGGGLLVAILYTLHNR